MPSRERARTASSKADAKPAPRRRPRRAVERNAEPANVLARLRRICLDLPESSEKQAWETPTFRVRDKMFAMYVEDHHGDGRVAMWCKAPLGMQEMLVDADPERFFVPPYVGTKGWLGVRLDVAVDWDEVADIVLDAYRLTAPKRLCAALEASSRDAP